MSVFLAIDSIRSWLKVDPFKYAKTCELNWRVVSVWAIIEKSSFNLTASRWKWPDGDNNCCRPSGQRLWSLFSWLVYISVSQWVHIITDGEKTEKLDVERRHSGFMHQYITQYKPDWIISPNYSMLQSQTIPAMQSKHYLWVLWHFPKFKSRNDTQRVKIPPVNLQLLVSWPLLCARVA